MRKNVEDNNEQQGFGGRPGFWGQMHGQFGNHGSARLQFGQRGWLRPAILKMIQEKPMNGMEMINRFGDASHGWWKPSPGSVYPLLETLETEGVVKKRGDGRYEVTKKFVSEFGPIGQVDELLTNMEGSVSYFEDMAKSDKAKLTAYRKRIENLSDRLSKIR